MNEIRETRVRIAVKFYINNLKLKQKKFVVRECNKEVLTIANKGKGVSYLHTLDYLKKMPSKNVDDLKSRILWLTWSLFSVKHIERAKEILELNENF